MLCPCQSQIEFSQCCEPVLSGKETAKTAEALMRARYTAYTQLDMDFVESSHDPKTRKKIDMAANKEWAEKTQWTGLEIVSVEKGQEDDDWGKLEFIASFTSDGEPGTHHEVSEFNKKDSQWYFTKGSAPSAQTSQRSEPKVGRNDPCPCGSGKKYKKCCAA